MLLALTSSPGGMGHDVLLSVVISVASGLLLLVGWFLVRTLRQVEDAIQAGKAETSALRTELGEVKSQLKDYTSLVEHLREETSVLRKAYTSLERAFTTMDKWLYGQAMQGKLPMPPNFRPSASE